MGLQNQLNKFKKDDWIGFCHYRRFWLNDFYDQNHKIKSSLYSKLLINNEKFEKTEVILAQPTKLKRETIIDHFINNHGDKMIFEAIDILDEKNAKDFKDYLNKREFSCCNMFITKPKILTDYCEFVFPYLLKILNIARIIIYVQVEILSYQLILLKDLHLFGFIRIQMLVIYHMRN